MSVTGKVESDVNWNAHNFFQKIYQRENLDAFCYGLGQQKPRIPFIFQALGSSRNPLPILEKILLYAEISNLFDESVTEIQETGVGV